MGHNLRENTPSGQMSAREAAMSPGITYRNSGVDIEAGDELVERLKRVFPMIGGFGGALPFPVGKYRKPVLVAGADGVGTKLLLAVEYGWLEPLGADVVAMCVNDVVACGARPLFFLDYYATGKLKVDQAEELVLSIGRACQEAGCVLLGGETAELPGLYAPGHFDVAGFVVGVAEADALLDSKRIRAGDLLIGLASSGIHSNGYSLVRRIVEAGRHDLRTPAPWGGGELGRELLHPTRIYVRSAVAALETRAVVGIAHITGGGLPGNVGRVIPEGLCAEIDVCSWPVPGVFEWLAREGPVERDEMLKTFNLGVGMVLVVRADAEEEVRRRLMVHGEKVWRIGRVTRGAERVKIV